MRKGIIAFFIAVFAIAVIYWAYGITNFKHTIKTKDNTYFTDSYQIVNDRCVKFKNMNQHEMVICEAYTIW